MKEKLIPAPLDEKNVTTDWISDIFDGFGDYVECPELNRGVGFINKCPVYVNWHDNAIYWRIIENNINNYDETLEIIKQRLKEYESDDEDKSLVSKIEPWTKIGLKQTFYFKPE